MTVIKCPECKTVWRVRSEVPLREQYCKLCKCALQLDDPEGYELVNFDPYQSSDTKIRYAGVIR